MTDLSQLPLIAVADGIAAGQFSAREVVTACLARIERLQPVLNCFISLRADEALEAADRADATRARGEALGPLHGVLLAHKDMYYRAGRISTCGSLIRREFQADRTATALDRLDAAGALDAGGLNMSEFAFGPTGHNLHWGDCHNPWAPDHITGGSSSGSGSAVAGRLVFGALGSDTGGSVRLPAGICGVVGLKPTQGRVSRHGIMGLSFSLDNVGPLARTVRDCARLLGVIAGPDVNDATASTRPIDDYEQAALEADVKGLRIGRPTSYYYDGADPEITELMDKSLQVFASLGAEVVDVEVPDQHRLSDLANVVMTSEAATLHGAWLKERPHDYAPQVRARIEPGFLWPATRYLQAMHVRAEILRQFVASVFSQCDLLHTPTLNIPVPTIAETDVGASPEFPALIARMTHCTRPVNYLGLPALAVPGGYSANALPVSFQLIGRPFSEAELFRAAAAYEAATPWAEEAPPL